MSQLPLRVVLADDAVLLREGLAELLGRFGHDVVAAVGNAGELINAVDENKPDVVVTDVTMPPDFTDDGLRAAMELRGRHPNLGVLVLSQCIVARYAVELLESERHSGLGFLLKGRVGAVTDFVDAVERIADGDTIVDPAVVQLLLDRQRRNAPLRRLTPREREVLAGMAEGKTNSDIADVLDISQAAVAKHIGSIFTKLNLSGADGHRRVLAVLTYLRS
jgi:DNA-binding NarL/FixJ family response regulator